MAVKKRGLGRGLSALIPEEPLENVSEVNIKEEAANTIDINMIEPNATQPRRAFDHEALLELSNSIKEHGILQPIIVRKVGKGYQIVAGERRWRAAKDAGLREIPALIMDIEELKATEIALIENIQREDLNPVEEAYAYKHLMENYSLTQEDVADVVGKSRPHIANITRLLNLSDEVLDMITNNLITNGHGRTLLSINDNKVQIEIAKTIVEKGLSVRETEKLVKEISEKGLKDKKVINKAEKKKDPTIIEIEESLRKVLGTKVEIIKGRKKGKIEIEYYNDEDLERIIELLENK